MSGLVHVLRIFLIGVMASGCSVVSECKAIQLGTSVSDVPDVRSNQCWRGALFQGGIYFSGPVSDVACCNWRPGWGNWTPSGPCAVDCEATGYGDGGTFQVFNDDDGLQCCIFVAHDRVEAVWVNFD
jgi:hypothetical protein